MWDVAEGDVAVDGGFAGETEDVLADDVVLDFIGAAGDRLRRYDTSTSAITEPSPSPVVPTSSRSMPDAPAMRHA